MVDRGVTLWIEYRAIFDKLIALDNTLARHRKRIRNLKGEYEGLQEKIKGIKNVGDQKPFVERMSKIKADIKKTKEWIYNKNNEVRKTRNAMKQKKMEMQEYSKGTRVMKRFKFEYLSLMFAGMALQRMFGGYIDQMMQMFGITDMLSVLMMSFLIPVFVALMPYIIDLFKGLMALDPGTKKLIGIMMVLITILGTVAMVIGMVGMAAQGLSIMFGAGGEGVGIMAFAGNLLLVVSIIALFVFALYHLKDIIYAVFTAALLPLNLMINALMIIKDLLSGVSLQAANMNMWNRLAAMTNSGSLGGLVSTGPSNITMNQTNYNSGQYDQDSILRRTIGEISAAQARNATKVGLWGGG